MSWDPLEDRRADIERNRENGARLAQAFAKFESIGQGVVEFAEVVDFGLTFIEEPYITYGSQLDMDDLGELLDIPGGATPPLPLVSGYVTEWDQDERGFYVGAWVAARVYFPSQVAVEGESTMTPVPLDTLVVIDHHFTFTAIAIKDVPLDVRD